MSDEIKRYVLCDGYLGLDLYGDDGRHPPARPRWIKDSDHAAIVERLTREAEVWKSKVEFLVPAARREGAEAMRERAAKAAAGFIIGPKLLDTRKDEVRRRTCADVAAAIRSLELPK